MSRGLQMLVEEGSIPHALMLCGPSGAETVHGFIKKRKKPAFPTLGKIRITRFLRFPTLGKVKNAQKLRFPTLEKVRITRFLRFSLERKAVVAHRKRP